MLNLYEFILWPNCNNKCNFCHQKKQKKITNIEKINSIKKFHDFVYNLNDLNQVLLVGGELFDNVFSKELENIFFENVRASGLSGLLVGNTKGLNMRDTVIGVCQ